MRISDDNVGYAGIVSVARTNHLIDENSCDTRGYSGRFMLDGRTDFEKEIDIIMQIMDMYKQRQHIIGPKGCQRKYGLDINSLFMIYNIRITAICYQMLNLNYGWTIQMV